MTKCIRFVKRRTKRKRLPALYQQLEIHRSVECLLCHVPLCRRKNPGLRPIPVLHSPRHLETRHMEEHSE